MSLFAELKRRNVLRLAAAYVVSAWLIIQVVETIFPAFGFGSAAIRIVVIVLAIGFVPVVVFAWAFELTPEGLKLDKDVDRSASITSTTGKKLDRVIMVILALALGYFAFDKFVLDPARDQEIAEAAREEGRDEAIRGSVGSGKPMVAALPFASIGGGEDSDFFAAGVHDDLLTQMAQLQSIRVISRTSVMEYADTERNIREIGEALGADVILEGGVQSAGNRIRINAQLIDARTDAHLWAETFDRELTPANIFEVQTEIARAITSSLQATLTEHDDKVLDVIPTQNMAAYRAYHRAMEIERTDGSWMREQYREALEEAVALDPNFTRAWVDLVQYFTHANYFFEHDPELTTRAEEIIERLRTLAPGSADYLEAQSFYVYYVLKDYDRASELISAAHALRPSDTDILAVKTWIQRRQGDYEGRIETIRQIQELTPGDLTATGRLVNDLMMLHRYDEAAAEIEQAGSDSLELASWDSLLQLREHGDLARWSAEFMALGEKYPDDLRRDDMMTALLAARDFTAAEALYADMPEPDMSGEIIDNAMVEKKLPLMLIDWFLDDEDRLKEAAAELQRLFDRLYSGGGMSELGYTAQSSLVAAVLGDREKTTRLVDIYMRESRKDLTARALFLHESCRILGIAGAAVEAADCIRTGLAESSFVMPFLDPFLPHYDPVREHPAFVELLAELDDSADTT